jgi:hypothetical protein
MTRPLSALHRRLTYLPDLSTPIQPRNLETPKFCARYRSQLTCGNVGKGSRLAAHTQSKAYLAKHGRFQVLPGFSDIMWPGMNVGMTGSITGTGTCPLLCEKFGFFTRDLADRRFVPMGFSQAT